jgi:hypothetical protein
MFIAMTMLFVIVCVLPALPKLAGQPRMRYAAERFGIPWRRYQLIGTAELAAAVGGLVGLFWRPAGLLAASGIVLLLAGALAFYRRTNGSLAEAVPALVALIVTAVYLTVALAA